MADGSKTSSTKRDSLKALRSDLNAICARLQAADNATEQSVTAMKTALHALAKHGDSDSADAQNRHAALERQMGALQSRLTAMIRDTQKAVNADLKTVLSDPRLSTLAQAIDNADTRLRKTEAAQAQNLARLQGYIANLAREVDVNLGEERKARQTALASVEKKQEALQSGLKACTETLANQSAALKQHETHLKSVETDTATALRDMGEKIATFAQNALESRQEQEREIKGKVSDIALETQRNFDLYRDGLDRNIEAMQAAHETAKRDFADDLETLRNRLETLEYGMRPMPESQNAVIEDAFTPPADTQLQPNVASLAPIAAHTPDVAQMEPPYEAETYTPEGQSQTPTPYAAPPADANPYSLTEPLQDTEPTAQPQPAYQPVEGPSPYAESHYPAPNIPAKPTHDLQGHDQTSAYGPVETYPQTQPLQADTPDMPYAGYDDIPYANPAYAEHQTTMQQARPGHHDDMETGGAKRSALFTPSNLRAAVLGVAVLGVSYFALNKVLGNKSAPNNTPPDNVFVESTPSSDLVADNAATTIPNSTSIKSLEPIGNYPEDLNRPLDNNQTTQTALEAAAAEGNDIAEYQLGLIKLQMGDIETALTLLRNSANKGQAAAQYRLAKLYETGNGVTKDLVTARELIEKAAQSGNRIAMHDLANFYANGIGSAEQDLALAAKWFEQAAERGVVDSQYNVGYLYEFGIGVTKNPVEAYVWYGVAASQGDTEAGRRITALNETLSDVEIDSAKKRIDGFKPIKLDLVANGIFENLPWQSQEPAASEDTQVTQAQTLLNALGYSVGTPDGQVGSQTRSAIIAFEKANGLPETGRINTALVQQLELAAGA